METRCRRRARLGQAACNVQIFFSSVFLYSVCIERDNSLSYLQQSFNRASESRQERGGVRSALPLRLRIGMEHWRQFADRDNSLKLICRRLTLMFQRFGTGNFIKRDETSRCVRSFI